MEDSRVELEASDELYIETTGRRIGDRGAASSSDSINDGDGDDDIHDADTIIRVRSFGFP